MISGAERIYKKLQEAYPNGMATISDLSRNTTDQKDFIVCNHRAFNFDLVNNIGLNGSKPRKEKTPDALFSKGQRLFFVEFKEGQQTDEKALIIWCRERLAGYKVPSEVRILKTLPRNPTGKIMRRELKKLLAAAPSP